MSAKVDIKKFVCQVCFLVPVKAIFQCQNCHFLCGECLLTVIQCPRCQVSLEGNLKWRNRALEEILDDLKIDCPFSARGCLRTLARRELASHHASCTFGKEVHLCKLIGYSSCDFRAALSNLSEVADHIETTHKRAVCTVLEEGKVAIKVPELFGPSRSYDACWLYLIKFTKPRAKMLFVLTLRHKENCLSINILDFNTEEKRGRTYAEISSEETPSVIWNIPVYHVMEAEERIKYPLVQVYMPGLAEQRVGGTKSADYAVNIKIIDTD